MLSAALRRQAVAAACGVIAVVATALVVALALRPEGWNVTALPRIATTTELAAKALQVDPGFKTVVGPYDGQYYWGIALDPLARGDVHQRFDNAPYRYGHPPDGWLGWLASAGQPRAAAGALLGIGLASMLCGAVLAALLAQRWGRSGWEGLIVAFNPGLLYSATHDLTEPLSAALLLGGFLAYANRRRGLATAAFALLVLSKEAFAVIPLAVAAWELLRGRRRLADVLLPLAALLPAIAWWTYLRLHLGYWFFHGENALSLPFLGWKRTLLDAGAQSYSSAYYQFLGAEARLVVVVALLGLLGFAAAWALRLRTPVDAAFLALAVVVACLANVSTFALRDTLRMLSVILVLVPFVIASPQLAARRRAGVAAEP